MNNKFNIQVSAGEVIIASFDLIAIFVLSSYFRTLRLASGIGLLVIALLNLLVIYKRQKEVTETSALKVALTFFSVLGALLVCYIVAYLILMVWASNNSGIG